MSLQSTDQIADLITRIRNAIMVGKTEIRVPTSKLKVAVTEGLKTPATSLITKSKKANPAAHFTSRSATKAKTPKSPRFLKSPNLVVAFMLELKKFQS